MFISSAVIAIIFRLVNFAIVIGLCAYAFKKYLMPEVMTSLEKKEAEKEFLFSEHMLLEHRQSELDQFIKQDKIRHESFKVKVDSWKRAVRNQYEASQKELLERRLFVEKSHKKKQELCERTRVEKAVVKTVIADLSCSLYDAFQEPGKGTEYIDSIICHMNEKAL